MPTLSDRLMPHLRRVALARDANPLTGELTGGLAGGLTDGQLLAAFLADRDPAAFEGLVRRHGPMVFGVCRRVIGHTHTAEDAFQAVFVVLARRAAAVRPREQLANWLFGVAHRTALKARAVLGRRRTREKQVEVMPDPPAPADVTAPPAWADVQPVLDAELAALPDQLRLPVVLCDLEGRTQRDAARQLGLPPATLSNRLTAARRRLAERLSARGVTLSGGLLATLIGANAARAAVPASLCAAAAKAGLVAVGVSAGAIPEAVHQLSEGVLRMMMLTKLKAVTAIALAGLLLLGGLGFGTLPRAAAQDGPTGQPVPAKPALGPNLSDAEFLKRMCDTLRGTPATAAEVGYFVADADGNKRKKAVGWLTEEAAAGKTNIDTFIRDRLILNEAGVSKDVELRRLSLDLTGTPNGLWLDAPTRLAFTPDGKKLAATDEKQEVVVYDVDAPKPDDKTAPKTTEEKRIILLDKSKAGEEPKADPKVVDKLIRWRAKIAEEKPQVIEVAQDAEFKVLVDTFDARVPGTTDADFLNKATAEARGGAPTKLEREYFLADKDPKKREKLLDMLLSDPAVAKKVGPDWKKNMLNPPQPMKVVWALAGGGADWSKLIGELQAAKKTDDQILECLALAITGRLPTDLEKKLVAAQVAKEKDKKAAWAGVAATLAGTDEAKKHAEKLKPQDRVIHFRLMDVAPTPEMKVIPLPTPEKKVIPLPKK